MSKLIEEAVALANTMICVCQDNISRFKDELDEAKDCLGEDEDFSPIEDSIRHYKLLYEDAAKIHNEAVKAGLITGATAKESNPEEYFERMGVSNI